jgi:hypothetical protein
VLAHAVSRTGSTQSVKASATHYSMNLAYRRTILTLVEWRDKMNLYDRSASLMAVST